ncbi:MAG: hypothetical protein IH828_06695 [Nitrospinae bacterium]|nr:hypothetical protein [Nitrospinota bacterium]
MIWLCDCGRANIDHNVRCVDCGKPRPETERPEEEAGTDGGEAWGVLESPEAPVSPPPTDWKDRRPPAAGFVGRTLRRVLIHYRRILGPFVPGLLLLVIPIQLGYIEISNAVMEGRASSGSILAVTTLLTGFVTLASYYLVVLTAFSVRDEDLALGPFYSQPPWGTIGVLWLATVAYGLAIFTGFLLLIVPGLAALSLLSMVQPLVVLDKATAWEALQASPRLVIGRSGFQQALQVLAIIVLTELCITVVSFLVLMSLSAVAEIVNWPSLLFAGDLVIGGLLFPAHAVLITILYDELVGIPRPEASA